MKIFLFSLLVASTALAANTEIKPNFLKTEVTALEALSKAEVAFEKYYLNSLAEVYPDAQDEYTLQQMTYVASLRGYESIIKEVAVDLGPTDTLTAEQIAYRYAANLSVPLNACEKDLGGEVRYIYDVYDYGKGLNKLPASCDSALYWQVIGSAISNARLEKLLGLLEPVKGFSWSESIALWSEGDAGGLDVGVAAPITANATPSGDELMKWFNYESELFSVVSEGKIAIKDFAESGDGPTDPSFKAFLKYVEKSFSKFNKVVYLAGGDGDAGYSRNVLVLVDKNNQAMAFSIGYSE